MTILTAVPAAPCGRRLLIIAAALLLPLLAFFGTAHSIVAIWQRSDTYAHGYLILPVSLWLIWRRRAELQSRPARPYWPALPALLGCGALWLLAGYGEVQIVRQYALAAMLPLAALAILGPAVVRPIAFPLCFLLLTVPFGDSLIAPLVDVTANLTVAALRLTGVPVLREGSFITIPSGNWLVAEACSGLRYLIASFTLGCLYAHLTYRTRWRQCLFVGFAVLMPVAANGARAYLIVMIGHLSGMRLAVGVDHLIYGWLFFGLVMLLMFWCGGFWRQPAADAAVASPPPPAPPIGTTSSAYSASPSRELAMVAAVALCLGVWPAYAALTERGAAAFATAATAAAATTAQATAALDGFRAAAPAVAPFTDWTPAFGPPSAELSRWYAGAGQPVGLRALLYRQSKDGAKLISSGNRLLPENAPGWHLAGTDWRDEAVSAGRTLRLRESRLSGPRGGLLVWSWYWIGGHATSNDYVGKMLQIKEKMTSGKDVGVIIMIFSADDEKPDAARAALRAFLAANLDNLDATLALSQRPR